MVKGSLTSKLAGIGIAGGLLGAAALGATVGVVGERYALRRLRRSVDPYGKEPFGALPSDSVQSVLASDGTKLHVEVVENPQRTKGPTVIFVHGFCLDSGTWHFQRAALSDPAAAAPFSRLVFYDQPGHGRSEPRSAYSLDQLADDLAVVVKSQAPTGPLVLVGHSMGGMVLMAFAHKYPRLLSRVRGIVLASTSAGHLDDVGLGLPKVVAKLRRQLMPALAGSLALHPKWGERGRMAGTDVAYMVTRHFAFGSAKPSRAMTEFVEQMIAGTSVEVIAGHLATLSEHDRYEALQALAGIETLVVCGDRDLVTPVEHSRRIAELLPHADLVEIADGGHLTVMEHHEIVTPHLIAFLQRIG